MSFLHNNHVLDMFESGFRAITAHNRQCSILSTSSILSPDSGKSASLILLDPSSAFAGLPVYPPEPAQASGWYHSYQPHGIASYLSNSFLSKLVKKYFCNTQFWPLIDCLLFSTWKKKRRKAGTRWTKPESAHCWPFFLTCSNHMWCAAVVPS